MHLDLVLPSVNVSGYRFSVDSQGRIVYGLGAIKGIGEGAIENIVTDRVENGDYRNLFDFCKRVDARRVNKRVLEALVRSGALDCLGAERAVLMAAMKDAIQGAEQEARNDDIGISDLFGETIVQIQDGDDVYSEFASVPAMSERDRLQGEKETLGLYVTGHPFDAYEKEMSAITSSRIASLRADSEEQRVAGLVVAIRTMKSRRGEDIAFVQLDDRTGRIEIALFSEVYRSCREHLARDQILVISGSVSQDDFSGGLKMRASEVQTVVAAREKHASELVLTLNEGDFSEQDQQFLSELLSDNRNGCRIRVDYSCSGAMASVRLGEQWRIMPNDDVLAVLRGRFGAQRVELSYGNTPAQFEFASAATVH